MKSVISIQAAFTPPPPHNDLILIDLDLINLNTTSKEDGIIPTGNFIHINLYLQDLRSLSKDIFMTSFSSNGINDQLVNHYVKDIHDNHTTEIFTALDNLMIISDETPKSHINAYKESDFLFTPKYSFLPNYQKVSEEVYENLYDSTILSNGNWQTIKKIKNSKAVLDTLKSSFLTKANNISMHMMMRLSFMIHVLSYQT
ncbi:hypothetical protein RclHR1_10800011 [Rhizophagus clarus]|uniref:Uncharacterized protein n=1 Tax=Rhizophagus clarus TaxID=94130 RepID=A0A2Z6QHB2_9GLOM|nr:hypothetical protein RclHR1_10800011 [Rhizophagus clarus]GES80470.1 hypothetical protein RCL_jg10795.t1 [Rhizophagus clarus]